VTKIPRPQTPDEMVFVSCYRFDTFRGFLAKILIPLVGVVSLVAFPLFAWRFYEALGEDVPPDVKKQFFPLLAALVVMGISMAGALFFLSYRLRKRFYDTFLVCNDQDLTLLSGAKKKECSWEEVESMSVRERGRLQTATVRFPKGRIEFDASMVNGHGPRPTVKMRLSGEVIIFPDSTTRPLRIRENELHGVIAEKLRDLGKEVS